MPKIEKWKRLDENWVGGRVEWRNEPTKGVLSLKESGTRDFFAEFHPESGDYDEVLYLYGMDFEEARKKAVKWMKNHPYGVVPYHGDTILQKYRDEVDRHAAIENATTMSHPVQFPPGADHGVAVFNGEVAVDGEYLGENKTISDVDDSGWTEMEGEGGAVPTMEAEVSVYYAIQSVVNVLDGVNHDTVQNIIEYELGREVGGEVYASAGGRTIYYTED